MLSLLVKLTLVAVLVDGFGFGELHQSRNKRAACGRCCHPVIGNSVFPGSAGAASQNLQFSYIMDAAGCYSLHLKCTGYGAVLLMMDTPSSLNNFLNMALNATTVISTVEADIPCTENVWGVAAADGVIGNAFTCQVEAEAPITGSSQTPPFDYPECYPTTASTPSTTTSAAPTTTPVPTTVPTPTTAGACTGQWTEWTNLTTCTQDCGMCGTKQMERKCLPAGCTCPGEQLFTKSQICEPGVCFHPNTSCCAGYTKVISNSQFVCEPTPVTTLAPVTTKCSGTWGPWVNGTCSKPCGSCGTMTQTRTCSPANCLCSGAASQSVPCNINVCLHPNTSCCTPYKKTIVSGEFLCL